MRIRAAKIALTLSALRIPCPATAERTGTPRQVVGWRVAVGDGCASGCLPSAMQFGVHVTKAWDLVIDLNQIERKKTCAPLSMFQQNH
jgi:hypothetical protein